MIPTILYSVITPALKHSTPLILRFRLGIDPILTPAMYSFATFLSQTVDLFLRLPIETVLRRGQMAVLASPQYRLKGSKDIETVVDIGPYRGTVGTMWSIIREEGTSSSQISVNGPSGTRALNKGQKAERKGQGLQGLWRGWRVGMWGIVGVWGSNAINGLGSSGGEF